MPTMSDTRRKKIQAKQRKAENARKRLAKAAKRERNAIGAQAAKPAQGGKPPKAKAAAAR